VHGGLSRPALYPVVARQHPFYIAIKNTRALSEGDAQDSAGGGAAHARQFTQSIESVGEPSAQFICYSLGRLVQVARPGVIAEPGPQVQHLILGRIRQFGSLVGFSASPEPTFCAPPMRGQHTREVLARFGFDPAEVDALVERGTVATADDGDYPWVV